jgi:hypothetical protein
MHTYVHKCVHTRPQLFALCMTRRFVNTNGHEFFLRKLENNFDFFRPNKIEEFQKNQFFRQPSKVGQHRFFLIAVEGIIIRHDLL